jgi:hypothetical protein
VVAVVTGLVLFVLTSFSDPGTVTAENVSRYISAYPYDGLIFVEKECSTCKITRYFAQLCALVLNCFTISSECRLNCFGYFCLVLYFSWFILCGFTCCPD